MPIEKITFGLQYFLYLIPLLLLELMIMGWKNCYFYRLMVEKSRSSWTDLLISSLYIFGFSYYFIWIFSFGVMGVLNNWVALIPKLEVVRYTNSPFYSWCLYFILIDFSDYWVHRWMHLWKPLWRIHAYHHSAVQFNILTGNRIHFLEETLMIIGRLVITLPFFLGLQDYAALLMVRRIINQLQHSDLPWTYGWIGKYLVISPMQHKIHHSSLPRHYDLNFGNIFVFWDRLFNSWHPAKKEDQYALGTDDTQFDVEISRKPLIMQFILWFELIKKGMNFSYIIFQKLNKNIRFYRTL